MKGFTLIEMLAVIIILSILVLLSFPNLLKTINKTDKELSEAKKQILYSDTTNYIIQNENDYPKIDGNTYCIKISNLNKSYDYKDIDLNYYIKVTVANSKYNFEYIETCE